MAITIPGIYQDVQEVLASNVDFVELNFADLPLRTVLRIRNVSGSLGISTSASAPTVTAGISVIGGSDGAMLMLIPGESTSVPPATDILKVSLSILPLSSILIRAQSSGYSLILLSAKLLLCSLLLVT